MATPENVLTHSLPVAAASRPAEREPHTDLLLVAGVVIAFGAILTGIFYSGVQIRYFFQPTGVCIVIGGTLGVMLVTTPRKALGHAILRAMDLISTQEVDREALIEEIVQYARLARRGGILALEPLLPKVRQPSLRDALQLAVDMSNREELVAVLETRLRMVERQGEADARTFEVAGGYAPTIGILGTVVGLIDVLRQFSNLASVGYGLGTAFVSTIYGLSLANLVLLPVAHRIRARVAEEYEIEELMLEGALSIAGSVHPSLIRMRLNAFLRGKNAEDAA